MPLQKIDTDLKTAWQTLDERIRAWWDEDVRTAHEADIRRNADESNEAASDSPMKRFPNTLLFLPHPYVTAGGSDGAFAEMYGWDTYFINLGLMEHDRFDLVRNHHVNQLFMIERNGMVLNGNRTYYLTRSQTPLLADGIRRYHQRHPDHDLLLMAYPLLQREYRHYWTAPHHQTPTGLATNRDLGDPTLRPALAAEAEATDFTACFDGDVRQCNPLMTNCALVRYARALAWMANTLGFPDEDEAWTREADQRAARIRQLCWSDDTGFFFDYHYEREERLPYWSLCGYWTLWADVATSKQAGRLAGNLARFEHAYGLAQTAEAYPSPHPEFEWVQWSYPAGWPPMHLIAVEGLEAYGFHEAAERIAANYLRAIVEQYQRTGLLWEKYNVLDGTLDLPVERYPGTPLHGFTAATAVLLGQRLFPDVRIRPSSSHPVMKETMKALHIVEPGHAVWREMPMPEPQAGEVLVKIAGVTTCPHWDLHLMNGVSMFEDRPLSYPYTPGEPGHEAVGKVVALGPGVEQPAVGTRVAAWRDPGGRRQGCYAQYVPLEADNLVAVPESLAPEAIAPLELAMCVQVSFDQLMQRDAVRAKRIGISGLGPAGLIAVQMARAYGAGEVVGIDPLPERRALALDLGADRTLPPDAEALPSDRSTFDAALDTTGLKASIEFLMARTKETVAIFGVLREEVTFGPNHWWGDFALLGYGAHNRAAADRALDLVLNDRLDLAPLVTHRLPCHRYAEGVALLRDKQAIKVLFLPWADH